MLRENSFFLFIFKGRLVGFEGYSHEKNPEIICDNPKNIQTALVSVIINFSRIKIKVESFLSREVS